MTNIRLLPVVILAVAALLVLKTVGLVTNGGYVLSGVSVARAAGGGGSAAGTTEADLTVTPAGEPTIEDTSPTLSDGAPTLGEQPAAAGGGHSAPAAAPTAGGDHGTAPAADPGAAPTPVTIEDHQVACFEADATITPGGEVVLEGAAAAAGGGHGAPETGSGPAVEGQEEPVAGTDAAAGHEPPATDDSGFAASMSTDCLPSRDAVPREITADGTTAPLAGAGVSLTEQQLLERLAARRAELQKYEDDLTLRASIVDAAEKRIEERAATLQALEAQISTLVDQRTEMETGQFAGIVSMYESMKPKDAAKIFNNLDMEVLLRVAKTMSPRKMAPILAEMDAPRAQELTVKMAALADKPAAEMTPDDLAALPQIIGQ